MIQSLWQAIVSPAGMVTTRRFRFTLGRLLAIGCMAFALAGTQPLAAQLEGGNSDEQLEDRRFVVFRLQRISAELAYQCLAETLGQKMSDQFRIQPDQQTNSLIAYVNEAERKILSRDLDALDSSMPGNDEAVRDLATATLAFTLIVERTADERLGSAEQLADVQFEALDAINQKVPGSGFQEPVVAISLATPISPRQLSEDKVGTKQQPLSLIAQMNSGRFELQGAGPGRCCGLQIKGSLVKQGPQYLLLAQTNLDMERPAVAADKPPKHEVAQLATEVVMTPGVPVLLSLSSLDGKKCLLMVELKTK